MSANEPIPPERQVLFGGTRWRLSMDSIYSYWVGMLGCPVENSEKDQEEQRSAEGRESLTTETRRHGEQRESAMDVDIICELRRVHVDAFIDSLDRHQVSTARMRSRFGVSLQFQRSTNSNPLSG